MSVVNTTAPATQPLPTGREVIERFAPLVLTPAFYGPPAVFVVGPWLLLVLLLIPPAALLITFALVFLVTAAALGALVGLVASPYFLVRQLRSRHPARRSRLSLSRRSSGAAQRLGDLAPRASLPNH
jgi:hypothetical protein